MRIDVAYLLQLFITNFDTDTTSYCERQTVADDGHGSCLMNWHVL